MTTRAEAAQLRPFRFCPSPRFVLISEVHQNYPGDVMTDAVNDMANNDMANNDAANHDMANHDVADHNLANLEKPEKTRKSMWWWPAEIVASGWAGAAAVVAFRGCWHGKMGWPLGVQGYSYQVCLSCGAMRLFDEKAFTAYGPFRNDLNELIAWKESTKSRSDSRAQPATNVSHQAP